MAAPLKISVCLATYQGERYVGELLASVLTQLGPADEVIISDDCSRDGTLGVVESFEDPRVTILRNTTNLGYSRNFAAALSAATGDVIFVCDQDDVWLPTKVATMVETLGDHDFVVADVTVVDESLAVVEPSHFDLHGVRRGFIANFARTRYIGASMAMHRRVLDAAQPFPRRVDLCAYDYWLALVAESLFDVALVREPLMLYRRHGSNASSGGSESTNSLAHKLRVRAYCLTQVSARWIRTRWRDSRH